MALYARILSTWSVHHAASVSDFVCPAMYTMILQVPVIICDYQLEVNLLSYNNSARRLQDGRCCDLRNPNDPQAPCLPQDSCDVRFTFSVQNFNTLMTFNSQTKVLGTYDSSDVIRFAGCSTLTNDVSNPLVFQIPTNEWNAGVS